MNGAECSRVERCPSNCVGYSYTTDVTYEAMSDFELIKQSIHYAQDAAMIRNYRRSQVMRHQLLRELYQPEKALMADAAQALAHLRDDINQTAGFMYHLQKWRDYMYVTVKTDCLGILKNISNSMEKVRNEFEAKYNLTELATYMRNYLFSVNYFINTLDGDTAWQTKKYVLSDRDLYRASCTLFQTDLENGYLAAVHRLPTIVTAYQTEWNALRAAGNKSYSAEVWLNHADKHGTAMVELMQSTVTKLNTFATSFKTGVCAAAAQNRYGHYVGSPATGKTTTLSHLELVKTDILKLVRAVQAGEDDLRAYTNDVNAITSFLEQNIHSVGIRLDRANDSLTELVAFIETIAPIFENYAEQFNDADNPPSKIEILNGLATTMDGTSSVTSNFQDRFQTLYKDIAADANQLIQSLRIMHDVVLGGIANIEEKRGNVPVLQDAKDIITNSTKLHKDLSKLLSAFVKSSESFRDSSSSLNKRLEAFNNSLVISPDFIKNNFIRLSIYYQSMTFETVARNPAYEWFSLLCKYIYSLPNLVQTLSCLRRHAPSRPRVCKLSWFTGHSLQLACVHRPHISG